MAKYGPFEEMHWDNDLEGRPEDRVETEPPKELPIPLTPEESPVENEDTTSQPPSATDDIDDTNPAHPAARTCVDVDAEVTEPEEHSMDH